MKIEDELREALQRVGRSTTPPPSAWGDIETRLRPHQQSDITRRLTAGLVAAVVAFVGVGVALHAFNRSTPMPPGTTPTSSPLIGSVQMYELDWGPQESASAIAALGGYAWTAGNQTSTLVGPGGSRTAIDLQQGPFSLSASSSSVWAAGFEPGIGNYVSRFPVGSPVPDLTVPLHTASLPSVLATDADVWVFVHEQGDDNLGTLLRLDPTNGSLVESLTLSQVLPPGLGVNQIVLASSADDEAVWMLVADISGGQLGHVSLVRLDARTHATDVFDPGRASSLIVGAGSVWLPGENGPVRLDPRTGERSALDVGDQRAAPFAVTSDAVWLIGGSATEVWLYRLDLVNGQPTTVGLALHVPRDRLWGSVGAVYDGAGSVWLLYETGHLQRVTVG